MNLAKRKLGSTGFEVSVIGLGTTKFGRNTDVKYPEEFKIPDDAQLIELLAIAKDNGVNLIDTAPAYGNSEERLGNLLYGQRQDWIIVSKAGEEYIDHKSVYNFTRDYILNSIKQSLRCLKTDYIDVFLIHSDGNDVEIINNYDVFETLNIAKKEGLIRASGMSTKTVAGGLLTLQHSDVAMVCYNSEHIQELPVIEAAQVQNKGILLKKALGSGHLDPQGAINFALEPLGVSSIIIGTINPAHLLTNLRQTY